MTSNASTNPILLHLLLVLSLPLSLLLLSIADKEHVITGLSSVITNRNTEAGNALSASYLTVQHAKAGL